MRVLPYIVLIAVTTMFGIIINTPLCSNAVLGLAVVFETAVILISIVIIFRAILSEKNSPICTLQNVVMSKGNLTKVLDLKYKNQL